MSKPNKLPMPIEDMISRAEIKNILNLNSHQMCYVTKFSPAGYPECIYRGPNSRMYYDRKAMTAWIAKHKRNVLSLIPKNFYELNSETSDGNTFDNKLSAELLRKAPINVIPTFKGIGGPTKRETLEERNDYIPPRRELTLYGNNGSHQLHLVSIY